MLSSLPLIIRRTKVQRKSKYSFDLKSNLLLIRHGESIFNKEIKHVEEIGKSDPFFHEKRFHVKFTERLIDSELTDVGVQQTKDAASILRDTNIKYVFVSPLRRALNTCNKVLENLEEINKHNKHYRKPKVIVHPYLFEKLEDNCDLFSDIPRKRIKFSTYDWSMFNDIQNFPLYFLKFCDNYINEEGKFCKTPSELENLKVPPLSNYYLSRILKDNQPFWKFLLAEMLKLDKQGLWIESSESTFERNKIFNKTLHEYSRKLKGEEKILAVGHSIFFKHLTVPKYHHEELESGDFAYLKNCQISSYYL